MLRIRLLDILFFAMVAAFIAFRLRNVLGGIIGIPVGLAYSGSTATGFFCRSRDGNSFAIGWRSWLACPRCRGVRRAIRFPGGLMFGAMIASAVLHAPGRSRRCMPVDCGHRRDRDRRDDRLAVRQHGSVHVVAISRRGARLVRGRDFDASAFVFVLTAFLPLRIADVVVAFSAGAQNTMMVLALALHLDPIFIGAHHLARYLLVSVSVPLVGHWLRPPRRR